MKKKNIVFIGMPGSGKSTVGRAVSEKLNMKHIDGDAIMEEFEGMKLQDIINTKGNDYVLGLEGKVLRELNVEDYIISPGGSCVYHPEGMEHLKEIGTIIYLKVDWPDLEKRCTNVHGRGIVFAPGETLYDLYLRRTPLYEKYADITVDTSKNEKYQTVEQILDIIKAL